MTPDHGAPRTRFADVRRSFPAAQALGGVAVVHATGYFAALVWTWFLARHVPLVDFGYLNWMLATALLFQIVFGFGFYQGLLRHVPRLVEAGHEAAGGRLYALSVAGVLLLAAAILSGLLAYFGLTGAPNLARWVLVVVCATGGALLNTAAAYFQALGRAVFGAFLATTLLPLVMGLILIAMTVAGRDSGYSLLEVAAASSLAIGGAAAVGALLVARRNETRTADRTAAIVPGQRLDYLAFCGRAMLITLVYQALASVDRIMLGAFGPLTDVGLYHFAAKLVAAMTFFVYVFPPLIGPVFARHLESPRQELALAAYRTSATLTTMAAIPIALIFATAGAPLLRLLAGPQFEAGATVLAILAVGTAVVTVTGNNGLLLQMGGRQGAELASSLVALGLNVVLNLILVPRYGPLGAAVATATSFVVSTSAKVVLCYRYWGVLPISRHTPAILLGGVVYVMIWSGTGWLASWPWIWRVVAALAGYVGVARPWRLRHDLNSLLGSAGSGVAEC
jgi:O-antigen/teichoic acid export membrane protein